MESHFAVVGVLDASHQELDLSRVLDLGLVFSGGSHGVMSDVVDGRLRCWKSVLEVEEMEMWKREKMRSGLKVRKMSWIK